MRVRVVAVSMLGVVLMSGCGPASSSGSAEPTTTSMAPVHATPTVFTPRTAAPDLGTYVWTALDGAELAPGGDLVLTLHDDVLNVSGGCNGIGGTYRLEDDVLVFSDQGQTLIGCAAPLLEQDGWVAELLRSRPTMTTNGDVISISNGTITVEFTDIEIARPDRPIEGTTWWVESTRELAGIRSPTQPASVLFTQGIVLIDSGCNVVSTFASLITPAELRVGPIQFTDAPCDEGTRSTEQAIIGALSNGQVTVEVHADRLRLIGAAGEIELLAGDAAPPDPLERHEFVHDSVEGRALVPGTVLRLHFGPHGVSAGGGCNSMDGPYRINGAVLVVGQLSQTLMACDPALHEQDEWLAGLLQSKPTVAIDGTTLTLTGHGATVRFIGRPADPIEPPPPGAAPATMVLSLEPPTTAG